MFQKINKKVLVKVASGAIAALLGWYGYENFQKWDDVVLTGDLGVPQGYVDRSVLKASLRFIEGTVVDVDHEAETITVRGLVVDVDQKSIPINNIAAAPSREIRIKVLVTPETEFTGERPAAFSVGDKVRINTKESVYSKGLLTAVRIESGSADTMDLIVGDRHTFEGVVTRVAEKQLIVRAQVIDIDALKQLDLSGAYAVPYREKEYSVGMADAVEGDFIVGDSVRVKSREDIHMAESINAVSVIKVTQ